MDRITRFRAQILIAVLCAVLLFFSFKLYDLQIVKTGGSKDNTATFTTYTRVKADRGDILDTNGNVLVGNRASYDLTINHYVLISANGTNNYLRQLIERCDEQGLTYTDTFPISQDRPFVYTLEQYNSTRQGYFQTYLAYMDGLDSDITAPLLVEKLRQRYKIPAEWTEELARRVIGLRYELELRNCVGSLPQYIFMADVSDEELSTIVELNVPGLNVEYSTVREYSTKYAAHILGFVGPMNAEQWEKYKNNPDYSMDSEIGQDGLEAAYEEYLHGVDGWREDTVTTDGQLVSSRYLVEPKAGSNVEVSIDINIQRAAEDALDQVMTSLRANEKADGHDAEGAAAVAIDVKTGQVRVCASYPSYDLATFFEDYSELLETDYAPLFNRALQGTYPPGSTYKMSMVVAGIDSGVISSETVIYDRGRFDKYSPFVVNCLYYTNYGGSHENCNAAKALMVSCNYFFYDLADKIRLSSVDSTAKGLGLGELTGVELYEETGHRANEETKKQLYTGDDKNFYKADLITASIGQSDNRFTPIQLCVYASTLANKGIRYKATFMSRVVSSDYRSLLLENEKTVMSHLEISDDAYKAYSEGMLLVSRGTDEWGGTAESTFGNYPIDVCAKTGTAQSGTPNASDNGAFICYAPADDPQIAIAVYGEKAGHGSSLAKVAKAMLDVYFSVGEAGDVTAYENKLS